MYWSNYKHFLQQFVKMFVQKFIYMKKIFLDKKNVIFV
jgi:hypothetical protein